ncbi:hypothetical protein M2222_001641 [Bradyrhizobium elkanii]|nr:hypothetical protein [Bradyrhizobium elkanii]MCS3559319.1 hypothetical protein [Bradyrhizobium elkanii]MCW2150835.1 hypothetical protein [Bradyrhizobium elkanii]MCW2374566.1 hypothetical protein [Bradyrhizobium elkanii]
MLEPGLAGQRFGRRKLAALIARRFKIRH